LQHAANWTSLQVETDRRQAKLCGIQHRKYALQRKLVVVFVSDGPVHESGAQEVMGQSLVDDDLGSTPQRFKPSRICTWRGQAVSLRSNDHDLVDGCKQGPRFLLLLYLVGAR
jgi:hypothetical protein